MRLLAGLVAVLVLAGCGAMAGRSGAPAAPAGRVAVAPPIQAVDEAPPEQVQRVLDYEFAPLPADFGETSSSGTTVWLTLVGVDSLSAGGSSTEISTTPTPAQIATFRAELDARRAAIEPAPGSSPRLVARLPLAGGGNAFFVAWHNHEALLCFETQVAYDPNGGGGGGASGPCAATEQSAPHCAALCLTSDGAGSNMADETWVLSGTVAPDADAIDVTTSAGTTAEYPLTGPLIAGGDRRVFMLELGKADWRKLVLLRGGRVVDESTMPAMVAASEDCMGKLGPMPPPKPPEAPGAQITSPPEMHAWQSSFRQCLTASGAVPPPLAAPLVGSTTP
ncbi:MAG TPA: hypothetical protein VF327_07080 [Gaiellaceae bacterium]